MTTKYPIYLGSIAETLAHQEALKASKGLFLGRTRWFSNDVITHTRPNSGRLTEKLVSIGKSCGYSPLVRSYDDNYALADYTYGVGSVDPHRDDGLGLLLAALIDTRSLRSKALDDDVPCIMQGANFMFVKKGDVFLFDANKEHTWIANCYWMLACQRVVRSRTKRKPVKHHDSTTA